MVGMKEYSKDELKLDINEIECRMMRDICIDERLYATYKVTGYDGNQTALYYELKKLKGMLYYFYMHAHVKITEEAEKWLIGEDSADNYNYLGEWSGFWYKWRNEIKWDNEKNKWDLPIWNPAEMLLNTIFSNTCDDCRFHNTLDGNTRVCLCKVKEGNLFSLPSWELQACSHYEKDPKDMDAYAEELVLDVKKLDEDEYLEAHSAEISALESKAHKEYWESLGSPTYDPEPVTLPREADAPKFKKKPNTDRETK